MKYEMGILDKIIDRLKRAFYGQQSHSKHSFVFLIAVSVRLTSFRCYSARSSGFYRALRFVVSFSHAGW